MSVRGWGGSVAVAIGVAAGAAAAQLGFGYGLGIVAWLPSVTAGGDAAWVASLAWAAWIAATATAAGAICADRLSRVGSAAGREGFPATDGADADDPRVAGTAAARIANPATLGTVLWRIALALAAAVGALVTVALVAVPARAAVRADTYSPQTIAAGYAVLGVIIGLVISIWALSSPAVAGNVVATAAWVWLLAVITVITGVATGRELAGTQLGVWQMAVDTDRFWFRDYFYWPAAALSLGAALVIGVLTARRAAALSATRVGATISGGAGPLLVALAYFLAAPQVAGIRAEQVSAHLIAPYAVIAGVAGSLVVAALAQRRDNIAALARPSENVAALARPSDNDAAPARHSGKGDTSGYGQTAADQPADADSVGGGADTRTDPDTEPRERVESGDRPQPDRAGAMVAPTSSSARIRLPRPRKYRGSAAVDQPGGAPEPASADPGDSAAADPTPATGGDPAPAPGAASRRPD